MELHTAIRTQKFLKLDFKQNFKNEFFHIFYLIRGKSVIYLIAQIKSFSKMISVFFKLKYECVALNKSLNSDFYHFWYYDHDQFKFICSIFNI